MASSQCHRESKRGFSTRWAALVVIAACVSAGYAMGCGSTAATDSSGTAGGSGEASVKSLSTLPTADLQSYDRSASSASTSTSESAPEQVVVSKGLGGSADNFKAVGKTSRAGCEANMHKLEIFRMSQEAQLDRCYAEAMEKSGFITIPTGSLALYKVVPPDRSEKEDKQFCDNIPEFDTERKQACSKGGEGPSHGNILMRVGVINGALQMDVCEGKTGAEKLVNEATYSASGSKYSATVRRIGNWGGNNEKGLFDLTVDLGKSGKVSDGEVTIGSDGTAAATAAMSGGFGGGAMTFTSTDSVNELTGAFKGAFKDPMSKAQSSFTGKVYTKFNSEAGCAKFSMTGSQPPMRASDMVPFDVATNQKDGFLQSLSTQLGLTLTSSNLATTFLCPNPAFDPANPSPTIPPMVAAGSDGTCGTVTHTGVECFSITNGTEKGTFANRVSQVFTIIDGGINNVVAAFQTAVKAFDVTKLDPTPAAIAFARNWDCTGTFSEINFSKFTAEQMSKAKTAMQKCFAIEEKLHANGGMGGYNCHQGEQRNAVNDFQKAGPPNLGKYGGQYTKSGGACPANVSPDKLFVNSTNVDQNKYCIPTNGSCQEFTVSSNTLTGLSLTMPGSTSITGLAYTQSGTTPATTVQVTWRNSAGASCADTYTVAQPTFNAPPKFGEGSGGTLPGQAGFTPQLCKEKKLTTEAACRDLCGHPGNDCSH